MLNNFRYAYIQLEREALYVWVWSKEFFHPEEVRAALQIPLYFHSIKNQESPIALCLGHIILMERNNQQLEIYRKRNQTEHKRLLLGLDQDAMQNPARWTSCASLND